MLALISLAAIFIGVDVQPSPAAPAAAQAQTSSTSPAGTKVPVHLGALMSSHDVRTGQAFTFYADQDVTIQGMVVIPRCALGTGTVTLAGTHGINGHEGNLRLKFDSLAAADGSRVPLIADEQSFNGKNRKTEAFLVSRWINGDEAEIKPDAVLSVVVAQSAAIGAATASPAVCPTPAPVPSPSP
jgi:hypothetical protein